jgi:hypothetical protein
MSEADARMESGSGITLDASQIGTAAAFYVAGACSGALFFGQLTDRSGSAYLTVSEIFPDGDACPLDRLLYAAGAAAGGIAGPLLFGHLIASGSQGQETLEDMAKPPTAEEAEEATLSSRPIRARVPGRPMGAATGWARGGSPLPPACRS